MLCQSLWCSVVIPTLLLGFAFHLLKALPLIYDAKKKVPQIARGIFSLAIIFGSCLTAKATIVATFQATPFQVAQFIEPTKRLSQIFASYKTSDYEDITAITQFSCAIENRFTYILTRLNKIEETNANIHKRYVNIKKRERNLVRNINKINIRETNAQMTLLRLDIPEINIQEINLQNSYDRIILYGNEIKKNINNPTCSKKCAFNHIDQSSIAIIYEIDEIHEQQNQINTNLNLLEKTFEQLEKVQRNEEKRLTQAGF